LSADSPKRQTPILLPASLTIKAAKQDADSAGLGALAIGGFGYQARHQGQSSRATPKTEAFAINARQHARLRNEGEAAM